jgi:hypothetical protein
MTAGSSTDEPQRTELASRRGHGITVRLLWTGSTNRVTVAVADPAKGDFFELDVDEHERAMEVFHHPYAHAAARG